MNGVKEYIFLLLVILDASHLWAQGIVFSDQSDVCSIRSDFNFAPIFLQLQKDHDDSRVAVPNAASKNELTFLMAGGVKSSCVKGENQNFPPLDIFASHIGILALTPDNQGLIAIYKMSFGRLEQINTWAVPFQLETIEIDAKSFIKNYLNINEFMWSYQDESEMDYLLAISQSTQFSFKNRLSHEPTELSSVPLNPTDSGAKENVSPLNSSAVNSRYNKVTVLFGTNREFETRQESTLWIEGEKHYFNGNDIEKLTRGIAQVSIPESHVKGKIERPSFWRLQVTPDPEKHVMIHSLTRQSESLFAARLQREKQLGKKSALVFVHGFNVSFNAAIRSTAVLGYDLGFSGSLFCYSWPSDGEVVKYVSDRTDAESAVPYFIEFLQEIQKFGEYEEINIIAHSMGNFLFSRALEQIDRIQSSSHLRGSQLAFNQLVLAAPDVDIRIFRDRFSKIYPKYANRVTLYGSNKDLALVVASETLNGKPRLGSMDPIVVYDLIDTIDASSTGKSLMEFDLNHSYYLYENFVHDLSNLIYKNLPPNSRALSLKKTLMNGVARDYWELR